MYWTLLLIYLSTIMLMEYVRPQLNHKLICGGVQQLCLLFWNVKCAEFFQSTHVSFQKFWLTLTVLAVWLGKCVQLLYPKRAEVMPVNVYVDMFNLAICVVCSCICFILSLSLSFPGGCSWQNKATNIGYDWTTTYVTVDYVSVTPVSHVCRTSVHRSCLFIDVSLIVSK